MLQVLTVCGQIVRRGDILLRDGKNYEGGLEFNTFITRVYDIGLRC